MEDSLEVDDEATTMDIEVEVAAAAVMKVSGGDGEVSMM